MSQPTSPSEDRPPSLVERISADLRADILSGRYRAGDRLPSERELAVRFETHRGTVREALKKLEQLGLAEIRPGGARAAPIEEASLDVVRHLMDLGPTPDPEVFDQIFEVFGALFSLSARLMVERGDETEHAHAQAILERLITEPLSTVEEFGLVQDLSAAFANASRNLVLKLVRKGLHTEVMAQIDHPETLFRPPKTRRDALLRALRDALAARDGAAASDAVFMLNRAVRENAVALLQDERVRAESAEPSKARTTERTPPDVRHGAPKR